MGPRGEKRGSGEAEGKRVVYEMRILEFLNHLDFVELDVEVLVAGFEDAGY